MVGDEFLLGDFEFRNGTVNTSTTSDGVDFTVDIWLADQMASFDYHLDLLTTPNKNRDVWEDADYVWFNDLAANAPVSIFGTSYTLQLAFGSTDSNGFSTIDSFHTIEGATASGQLWGRITGYGDAAWSGFWD